MPVKNIKRRTNDGLEGTITGLTKEEKEVLNKSGFASSKDVEELTKVMPTDVAIKDNKLGLEHDSTWLTNQKAINLGSNMTYDAETNTLDAAGGDELTGAAIMGVTRDSDTITRTLDTDGKVKFDTVDDITTKQDKLYTKTNSGITLTEESGKSYIGSQIIYKTQNLNLCPVFHAGTHQVGDILSNGNYQLNGLFLGEDYESSDQTRLVKIDDVVIMRFMYPIAQSGGIPNEVHIDWCVIQGGTIAANKQIISEARVITALNSKRVY